LYKMIVWLVFGGTLYALKQLKRITERG